MNNQEIICVVIPAFNEANAIASVIQDIRAHGIDMIIVVDDGSSDSTYEVAKSTGVIALQHKLNRGKGAATKTAITAAKALGATVVVTMDGDGQHEAKDIAALVAPLSANQADVTLGVRTLDRHLMPMHRRTANYIANVVTWQVHGLWVTDSQSGFRAFTREGLNLIDTRSDKYEYDSEVIREIFSHQLRFVEIPIHVRYTQHSTTKTQRQDIVNGLKTIGKMVWHRIA